jgi:hypothetical protein
MFIIILLRGEHMLLQGFARNPDHPACAVRLFLILPMSSVGATFRILGTVRLESAKAPKRTLSGVAAISDLL